MGCAVDFTQSLVTSAPTNSESGVALRFPPHSKTLVRMKIIMLIGVKSPCQNQFRGVFPH